MDPGAERRELARGVHIVVGTPGRLRDHLERRALKVSALKAVVLDEADEMLDMGFREDLQFILETTPPERRTRCSDSQRGLAPAAPASSLGSCGGSGLSSSGRCRWTYADP